MTTYDNAPPPPDWRPEPHADPFRITETLTIPPLVILGEN
jgi:hypothetical protein